MRKILMITISGYMIENRAKKGLDDKSRPFIFMEVNKAVQRKSEALFLLKRIDAILHGEI
jgi:hypothetical protein